MHNRRTFLKKSVAVSMGSFCFAGTNLYFSTFSICEGYFLDVNLRVPQKTLVLKSSDVTKLWNYYKFIGSYWNMSNHLNTNKESFTRILDLKTSLRPSYFYEYMSAIQIFEKYKSPTGRLDFEKILLHNTDDFLNKFVTLEFINLTLTSGGFKRFGYKNYAGYAGGRFDNPMKLPYRT